MLAFVTFVTHNQDICHLPTFPIDFTMNLAVVVFMYPESNSRYSYPDSKTT